MNVNFNTCSSDINECDVIQSFYKTVEDSDKLFIYVYAKTAK